MQNIEPRVGMAGGGVFSDPDIMAELSKIERIISEQVSVSRAGGCEFRVRVRD